MLPKQGLSHQLPMPDVPRPEELPTEAEIEEAASGR